MEQLADDLVESMNKLLTNRSPRESGRRFVSAIYWLGIGLTFILLLWSFVFVLGHILEQWPR